VRRRAGGDKALSAPARGRIERVRLGRLGRYRAQLAKLGDESVAVLIEVAVEQVGHAESMSNKRRGSLAAPSRSIASERCLRKVDDRSVED
jgi:hypothetical protein